MNDDEIIRKVYETYGHLSDDDIIERLAMLTTEDETLIIEDTEVNDEWKNLSIRTSYITNKYYKIESLYKIIVGEIADFNKHFKYIKSNYKEVKKDDFIESNVIRHFIKWTPLSRHGFYENKVGPQFCSFPAYSPAFPRSGSVKAYCP